MTMPHLMNCPHQGEGWCLACVKQLWEENESKKEGDETCGPTSVIHQSTDPSNAPEVTNGAEDLPAVIDASLSSLDNYHKPLVQFYSGHLIQILKAAKRSIELERQLAQEQKDRQSNGEIADKATDELTAVQTAWTDDLWIPGTTLPDSMRRVAQQFAAMREALEGLKHGDGCYCEAAFASGKGEHPRHSPECERATKALSQSSGI